MQTTKPPSDDNSGVKTSLSLTHTAYQQYLTILSGWVGFRSHDGNAR